MKILFITGTNTGVGKTLASALLCRELSQQENKVAYIKPVQTGCFLKDGELQAPDLEFVKMVCGDEVDYFCPLKFKLPASPHLSAAEEGSRIDEEKLVESIKVFCNSDQYDYVIIEGAGGITVPLNSDFDMLDLCKRFKSELIVVTTKQLGTLNHTKLTLEYAKAHGFECSIILSGCSEQPNIIEKDNIKLISEMVEDRVLFQIPQIEGLNTESERIINIPQIILNKLS